MHMSRRSFIHSMSNSLNLASMDEEASNLHVRPLNKIIRKRVFFFKNTSGKQRRGTKFLDYHRPVVNQNESSKFAKLPMTNTRRDDEKYTNRVEGGPKVQNWGNYRWSGHSFWVFSFLLLLFPFDICATDPNQCSPGLNTPGRTSPLGDIVKEYGQSLKIYCILNETLKEPKFHGKNSSDLVFYRNDREMEPEYVTVINKTTIAMYVDKPEPSSDMYYCKLRLGNGSDPSYEAVCLNKVVIGFKPKEPLNFSCISQNWENLTCTWVPAPNYVATKFSLGYKLPGRAGGRTTFNCPETKNDPKFPPNTCTWDATTDPPYRMVHENFKFVLTAENVLGINHFIYQFHHWAHVIPAKPVGLSVVNKTFSSALLHWNVPYPMGTFPPGLHHKISYQSLWDGENSWKTEHIRSAPRQDEKYFNLTNLQYANTPYDVRIFSKSALAVGEDSWSLFSDINFRTAATLPGLPVKTDIGSFEIVAKTANRDVYIYWQSIPAYLENGDNFTYKIVSVEENGKKVNLQPQEKTKTYAKFKGIGVHSFRFEIVTANCKGENEHKAVVHVPSKLEMPREPDVFTKIAFDAGLYELSWNPPRNSNVVNYTIFWCENDRDRPYQCTGYLDWVHVNRTVTVHNITVPDARKVYQFAIAANTDRASSGMVWASCTAIHNNTIGKMKSVWINRPESYQIEIGWKLECSDRIGIVEGFRIYYCPIVAPQNLNCKGEKLNRTVKADPQTMRGIVTDLKPYTTYMLSVAVLTKNGEGPASDPQYSTTLEGAPSVPLNVMVKNVTNTSMAVQWEAPVAMNGVLRYYHVHYNQNKTRVEGAQGNATQVVIEGLKPHTRYNISVSACTVTCGNLSSPIDLWTDIGVPGKMEVPAIRFMNTSQIQIVWNPPREPAGLTDFYEIETEDKIYTNITNHEKYLDIADCQTNRNRAHLFRVRAINFGPKKTRLEGPWSEAGEGTCYNSGPPDVTWMLVWIFGSLIGVAVLLFIAYSSKRLWTKCKAMQDVEVKLPPGLASNTQKLLGPPNEQHLPPRSVDSSGCSSGQESVTSSLTSESHVSTDSGADLDPLPMSPTKLLESPPTWESSRLRQRIVAGTKPESCNDHEQWDSYVKVAKTLDTAAGDVLSLAKSTPNLTADITDATPSAGLYGASRQHAWSSTGYISMPSSSSSTASSEEESSNSPSPSPHGQGSNQGVYSIVGLAPPPAFATKTGVGAAAETSGANSNHPQAVNLIPLEAEPRLTTAATSNPYVSLASLEEKTKNTNMPHLTSLGNFEEMKFVHPIREVEHSQLPMSDKYCKPYVRTGLNDTMMKSCPPNELDDEDALNACYAVTGEPFGQSLIQLPKHAYVPVGTRLGALPVSSAKDSPQTQSPYVSVSTMISMLEPSSHGNQEKSAGVHDHFAPSYPFSSGITESSAATLQSLDGHGDRVISGTPSVSTSLPIVKQTSGYVTIAENPSRPIGNTTLESSTLSYVPHQQVDQKSPLSQQNVNRADEQYSKVTVVPTST